MCSVIHDKTRKEREGHFVLLNKYSLIISSSQRNVGHGTNPPPTHDEGKGCSWMRDTTGLIKTQNTAEEVNSEVINECWLTLVGAVMEIDKEHAKIIGQLVRETRLIDAFEDYGVDIRFWEITQISNTKECLGVNGDDPNFICLEL